jgi:DNA replication protein DnaD
MTFEPAFKEALKLIPEKEKDKLILRLLKYDLKLIKRLKFELMEEDSVEDKRAEMIAYIETRIKMAVEIYYSAGYLLMDLREISGEINSHIYTTKDKFGEISLNCLMLRFVLELTNEKISEENRDESYRLYIYIVARIFKILILIQKQHEDLHLEFRDDMGVIGYYIGKNKKLKELAIKNGLDINWLSKLNIPEDIVEIHKELRNNGFLK